MFVTDTHPLVWYSTEKHNQLSRKVLSAFQKAESAETLIYVPAVVFREIALLKNLRKIKLKEQFDRWADGLLAKQGFDIIPLETSIIWQSIGFNFK